MTNQEQEDKKLQALVELGLNADADEKAIKRAYYKLTLKYHPDKNSDPSAQEKFVKIAAAYEFLTGKETEPTTPEATTESTEARPKSDFVRENVARKIDLALVKKHIGEGKVDLVFDDGDTLLLRAAKLLKQDCLDLLLEQKDLMVNFQDNNGNNVINILAGLVNSPVKGLEYIQKFHAKGAKLDFQAKVNGFTPLMSAVANNNEDLVKYFLSHKLEVQTLNKQGKSALDIARANKVNSEIITSLEQALEKTFMDNKDAFSLVYSFKDATPTQVKKWIANGLSINAIIDDEDDTTLVMHYIKHPNIPVVEALVKAGAKLDTADSNGNTPLLLAAMSHDKATANKLVDVILKKPVDLNAQNNLGYSAIMYAAEAKNNDLVITLVNEEASITLVSKSGKTVKDFATSAKLPKSTIAMFDAKEEAEYVANSNLDGYLSKHNAPTFAQLEELVSKKFNINTVGKDGITLLKIFTESGNFEAVKFLADNDANLDHKDSNGNTALMLSTKAGHNQITELLVDRQADVDIQNNDGESALMFAAKTGNKFVTDLLVDNGATTTLKSHEGKTAEDYATKTKSGESIFNVFSTTSEVASTLKKSEKSEFIANKDLASLMNDKQDITFEEAKEWLDQGLDVNAEGKNKVTLLTYFAAKNDLTAVTYLVNKHADVNHQNAKGETALHLLSSIKGNVAKVYGYAAPNNAAAKFIIDSRAADLCLIDKLGHTVYQNTLDKGNQDLQKYIDDTGFVQAIDCTGKAPSITDLGDL